MKSIIVLSGGMDSVTALHYAKKKLGLDIVQTVSFDYGSKHNDQEYKYAKIQSDLLGVENIRVDLKEIGKYLVSDLLKSGGEIPEGHYADPSMKKTVVPFRNGIMLSIATGIAESCGAEAIVLGNHFGDHAIYPDCRTDFINPMKEAIENGTYANIKLLAPFSSITKTDIAKIGHDLNIDYSLTYSCYKGQEKHCGKCGTCFERKEAFQDSGLNDPTEYEA
jgi:7-cyano-7-deazaguanine synthase